MTKIYRCKKCKTTFPDEIHLKRHEEVHKHAKPRIVEFGDPEFSKDRLR
jgi:tRNA(Ile2) C34 agmatinyltransferase TiaS